jgi:hypothetical protein
MVLWFRPKKNDADKNIQLTATVNRLKKERKGRQQNKMNNCIVGPCGMP